jgi:hypothetical protein
MAFYVKIHGYFFKFSKDFEQFCLVRVKLNRYDLKDRCF